MCTSFNGHFSFQLLPVIPDKTLTLSMLNPLLAFPFSSSSMSLMFHTFSGTATNPRPLRLSCPVFLAACNILGWIFCPAPVSTWKSASSGVLDRIEAAGLDAKASLSSASLMPWAAMKAAEGLRRGRLGGAARGLDGIAGSAG